MRSLIREREPRSTPAAMRALPRQLGGSVAAARLNTVSQWLRRMASVKLGRCGSSPRPTSEPAGAPSLTWRGLPRITGKLLSCGTSLFGSTPAKSMCCWGRMGRVSPRLCGCSPGPSPPASGRVEIDGGPSAVGLAPQEIALYPWLTARENVFAFARLAGLSAKAARERALWALEVARCSDVGDTQVARLSGGYRRRANIAAALVGRSPAADPG